MARGVRADVTVGDPGTCPLASLSGTADVAVSEVTWCDCPEATLVEFTAPADAVDATGREAVDRVYESDGRARYRMTVVESPALGTVSRERAASDGGLGCPCAILRNRAQPVADVRADAGVLSLTFYAADSDAVRDVVETLRECFDAVSLERLSQGAGGPAGDPVLVDRARLTDRQRETLETAHEMGYFRRRRQANAVDVADALDISPSTFTEHVGAALDKVLAQLFER